MDLKTRAFPKKCEAVFGLETRQTKEARASFRCIRNGALEREMEKKKQNM